MKINISALFFLLSLITTCAAEEPTTSFFFSRVVGAALDKNKEPPDLNLGGDVDSRASFENGRGIAVKTAISFVYLGYQNVVSKSRTTDDEVEYRTYSIGISIRETDWRNKVLSPYYELSLGAGHSEAILNSGRADHNSLLEAGGSLGFILYNTLSVGIGVNVQFLGHPYYAVATSANPNISLGAWF